MGPALGYLEPHGRRLVLDQTQNVVFLVEDPFCLRLEVDHSWSYLCIYITRKNRCIYIYMWREREMNKYTCAYIYINTYLYMYTYLHTYICTSGPKEVLFMYLEPEVYDTIQGC